MKVKGCIQYQVHKKIKIKIGKLRAKCISPSVLLRY